MDWIKHILMLFLYILACTIIASALFITLIEPNVTLDSSFLWQSILLSLLCALATFVYYSKYELSKGQILLRKALHLIIIITIMLSGSIIFRWINTDNFINIILMLITISIVYIAVNTLYYMSNKMVANQLNERLEQIKNKDED